MVLLLISVFFDRNHGRWLIPRVWRERRNTREQVKRDPLLSDPYDHPLRFLIGGDHLAFLFSQGNKFRNLNRFPYFFGIPTA